MAPSRLRRALASAPTRRAALRRGVAGLVSLAVLAVAGTTHRQGVERERRWGDLQPVAVVVAPVAAGELVGGRVRTEHRPAALLPEGHLRRAPRGGRATVDLVGGEVLTSGRVTTGDAVQGTPGRGRALVPVPLDGRDAIAPDALAEGDVVQVIAAGTITASGGREPARVVATDAVVRSVAPGATTLEVPATLVAALADALLGGPVVLTVTASADAGSGP